MQVLHRKPHARPTPLQRPLPLNLVRLSNFNFFSNICDVLDLQTSSTFFLLPAPLCRFYEQRHTSASACQ